MKTACDSPLAFYTVSHHLSVSYASILALSVLSWCQPLSPLSGIPVFKITNVVNTYLVLSTWKVLFSALYILNSYNPSHLPKLTTILGGRCYYHLHFAIEENGSTERLRNLPKVTQPISAESGSLALDLVLMTPLCCPCVLFIPHKP